MLYLQHERVRKNRQQNLLSNNFNRYENVSLDSLRNMARVKTVLQLYHKYHYHCHVQKPNSLLAQAKKTIRMLFFEIF